MSRAGKLFSASGPGDKSHFPGCSFPVLVLSISCLIYFIRNYWNPPLLCVVWLSRTPSFIASSWHLIFVCWISLGRVVSVNIQTSPFSSLLVSQEGSWSLGFPDFSGLSREVQDLFLICAGFGSPSFPDLWSDLSPSVDHLCPSVKYDLLLTMWLLYCWDWVWSEIHYSFSGCNSMEVEYRVRHFIMEKIEFEVPLSMFTVLFSNSFMFQ